MASRLSKLISSEPLKIFLGFSYQIAAINEWHWLRIKIKVLFALKQSPPPPPLTHLLHSPQILIKMLRTERVLEAEANLVETVLFWTVLFKILYINSLNFSTFVFNSRRVSQRAKRMRKSFAANYYLLWRDDFSPWITVNLIGVTSKRWLTRKFQKGFISCWSVIRQANINKKPNKRKTVK